MAILRLLAQTVALTVALAVGSALTTLPVLSPSSAVASEFGTKDEAMALVKRGIEHIKAVGPEKAFADFTDKNGGFVDRDLYLIVTDKTGTRVAHGQNAKLVGKNIATSVDVDGKAYGKEIVDMSNAGKSGWVSYKFSDPVTKKVLPKESYYEPAGDFIVYCGVYSR